MKQLRGKFFLTDDGHRVHYLVKGRGTPIVHFHGGPGLGFSERAFRFYNFAQHRVLFIDQRGAGLSKPSGAREQNNTQALIADTFAIMDKVGMEQAFFVGSSWGSTMALLSAIHSPHRCRGIVASAIFLADRQSTLFLFDNTRIFAPDALDFVARKGFSDVATALKNDSSAFVTLVHRKIHRPRTTPRARKAYAQVWHFLGSTNYSADSSLEQIWRQLSSVDVAATKLELSYVFNDYFLPPDFILQNIGRISHLPIALLHGRHDHVCPLNKAYQLHRALPNSRFRAVDAGHSPRPANYTRAIIEELQELLEQMS